MYVCTHMYARINAHSQGVVEGVGGTALTKNNNLGDANGDVIEMYTDCIPLYFSL